MAFATSVPRSCLDLNANLEELALEIGAIIVIKGLEFLLEITQRLAGQFAEVVVAGFGKGDRHSVFSIKGRSALVWSNARWFQTARRECGDTALICLGLALGVVSVEQPYSERIRRMR